MARFRRWYRRYRRYRAYRRAFRYNRYGRSYARKYVNSSSRSNIRMKCNQTLTSTAVVGYGNDATSAAVYQIQPYTSSLSSIALVANPLYRAYVDLYEETKLIGFKVDLSVSSAVGGSDTPSLQIYTAFDRRHGSGEPGWTVDQIKSSANSSVATAVNNNVAKISRSVFASDLMEKAQWHDSTLNAAKTADSAWQTAAANPNFFCPTMFYFFNSPSLGAQHNISINVSVTYYVAFRNPKYGASSASSKLAYQDPSVFPDEGGDMDGGDMILMDDASIAPDGAASASADPPPARKSVMSKAPSSNTAARVVQIRRQQQQRNLRDESLNE